MNVLFVDQYGELGGAQRCLLELIPAVLERGWRPFAIVPAQGGLGDRLRDGHVNVQQTGDLTNRLLYPFVTLQLSQQIRKLHDATQFDLLYVNGPRVLPAAALACRDVPLVFHAHSYLPMGASRILARASIWRRDSTVIAVSNFVAGYMHGAVAPDRLHVIPNGAPDLPRTRPPAGPPRIGIIGRVSPEKGQHVFVEAVRLLPRNWQFFICGTSIISKPGYEQLVLGRASGLPIEFLGWHENIGDVLGNLDLLVVPSAPNEGLGRVILEAFSAQVPVVAFPSGGIPELIQDNRTGYLVAERTPEGLAARIRAVLNDPASRNQVTQNARALFESNYTLALYGNRVTQVMQQAANPDRPSV